MLDIMDDGDINNDSFMKFIKSDPDEESMCNTRSDEGELLGLGGKDHYFLGEPGSCRTEESDGGNSQPKVYRTVKSKSQYFGVGSIEKNYELNLDREDRDGAFFGGFHDGPGIAKGSDHKPYCKRKLELSYELNKRQRYIDHTIKDVANSVSNKAFNSVAMGDEQLRMGNGCKNQDQSLFGDSYVAETARALYHNTEIFNSEAAYNTVIPGPNSFGESYDVVTGNMLPLRLTDISKKSEASLSFPLIDGGNYLLGEPLRDFTNNTSVINQTIAPCLINHNNHGDLLMMGACEKENVIDPRVIFKSNTTTSHLGGISNRGNNNAPSYLSTNNNSKIKNMTDIGAKIDRNISKKLPLIAAIDENILGPQKKTIMLTYPTPDQVSDRGYNTETSQINNHTYNKSGLCTSDIVEHGQKEIKQTDASKPASKTRPKPSQKLLYIHNLSRSNNTKIDETVAYLHYKLRGYENMAVLTRIRNILQNHQLNLIGICGQLGIPELLVPRRTN